MYSNTAATAIQCTLFIHIYEKEKKKKKEKRNTEYPNVVSTWKIPAEKKYVVASWRIMIRQSNAIENEWSPVFNSLSVRKTNKQKYEMKSDANCIIALHLVWLSSSSSPQSPPPRLNGIRLFTKKKKKKPDTISMTWANEYIAFFFQFFRFFFFFSFSCLEKYVKHIDCEYSEMQNIYVYIWCQSVSDASNGIIRIRWMNANGHNWLHRKYGMWHIELRYVFLFMIVVDNDRFLCSLFRTNVSIKHAFFRFECDKEVLLKWVRCEHL